MFKVFATFFFLFLFAVASFAQVFQRPFDPASALALGGATIAMPSTSAGIANEAVLGRCEKAGAMAGASLPYSLGDWQVAHFQGFVRIDSVSAVGIELQHSAIKGYGEQRARLQYGRRLGTKLWLGANVDVFHVSAEEYASKNAATFGIALLAQPLKNCFIAARINNPLQLKIGENVPANVMRIGFSWKVSPILLLLVETEKDLERPAQLKLGLEYQTHRLLALRTGIRTHPVRPCLGAALQLKNGISLDFGSEWHTVLGITPAAGLRWRRI